MSPAFEWSSDFVMGIEIIDSQHQKLIAHVNDLIDSILKGEGAGQVKMMKLVSDLIDYAKVHFETEETLMQQTSYPGYNEHRERHEVCRQYFQKIKLLAENNKELPTVHAAYFLIDWINHHILEEDKKMAAYLREKNCK